MSDPTTAQAVLFAEFFPKPLLARFDQRACSSDGGAVLLKAADRRLGLIETLAGCLRDDRQPGKVLHEIVELLCQRIYAIACGWPDGNDAARLADDPVYKLLAGRDPIEGDPLASQSTLSRFENSVGARDAYRLGRALAEAVVERHRKRLRGRARRITLDLDDTDDPTHGAQQLTFFHDFYNTWCYLPLFGFLSFDDEPDQYLVAAILRPGNAPHKRGAVALLRRLLPLLRKAFPGARLRVRLDAGFYVPEILDFLDAEPGVEYVIGAASNAVFRRRAQKALRAARRRSRKSRRSESVYDSWSHQARHWSRPRRIVLKAEVVRFPGRDPQDNPRYLVTNLRQSARHVYERVYCPRGDSENRIKELLLDLAIDRTSCSRFWANQLRVLLTAAAYVLMQELRLRSNRSSSPRMQVGTLRDRFLKLGAQIVVSVRRLVLHLPFSFPARTDWRRLALSLGAVPT